MVDYPKGWVEVKLEYIMEPQSFKHYICKTAYSVGKYPIIQQGDEPIYGFSNVSAYTNFNNVLLFGDHTLSLYKPIKPFLLSSDGVKILECSKDFIRDYIFYLLKYNLPQSEGYKRHYTIIKNIKVPIAINEIEQKAIADTLMTFDSHIENLERLIEKKKMVRDGAVEDLMTGKTRLDGFRGEWADVKLCNVTEILTGLTYSPEDVKKNGVLVLRSSNIQNDKLVLNDNIYVDESKIYSSKVKVGDIIMCVRNGSSSLIGKTAIVREKIDATFGAFMSNLRCYDFINCEFIYYFFKTSKFREEVDKILGATINQIIKSDLNKLVFKVPTDIKEQEAIAFILTSMDEEIENLEKEKEKIEKIKDGAMDDLLTGRVRLI